MKTIWMALHDLRHDIGFALFLILELSISVFFHGLFIRLFS